MDKQPLKIARIATVPFFLDNQLRQQMSDLINDGYEVSAISSKEGQWDRLKSVPELKCIQINIERAPSPIKDIISLIKLITLFATQRYDIVHSTTPKAGLLCACAAWVTRTPVRLHTFTGQTWANKKGLSRKILTLLDKIIVKLNTRCYADSHSQKEFLIDENIGTTDEIIVLASGSLAGVDLNRFNTKLWEQSKSAILNELDYTQDDFVIIFIGRVSKDKGIHELMGAYSQIKSDKTFSRVKLLLVGPCEEAQLDEHIVQWEKVDGVHFVGNTNCPEKYLSISRLLCLPSYREGFGTVVIEAAAMGVPTLGTNIVGLKDAIVDGKTGVMIPAMDEKSLKEALLMLIKNEKLLKQMSSSAYERCCKEFSAAYLSNAVANEYNDCYKRVRSK